MAIDETRPPPPPGGDATTEPEVVPEPEVVGEVVGEDPRFAPRPVDEYREVDVAIVAESTYPYLKGGVSAVIHDIVTGNPGLTFGIIHIAWDSKTSRRDLYGMPSNVQWVHHVYLSMQEHRDEFMMAKPKSLRMRPQERTDLAHQMFDALAAISVGDYAPFWELYDAGINPKTRSFSIWPILGTKEFMTVALDRLQDLGLPFTDTFWLLRDFFSLAYAILSVEVPPARVYHAHTTGYASVLGVAGARQNGMKFLLTEHNLYVRDTVNFLLDRSLDLPLTDRDWRQFDVLPDQRAWMAWWIEMAHLCYPSAEVITYLYPAAITEAADLGSPIEKSTIVPNGMQVQEFDKVYGERQQALTEIVEARPNRKWRLAYIARVVPIKGLVDLISAVDLLRQRGVCDFHLDVLGPTDHAPDYYLICREKARDLAVEDYVTFRGTVAVRDFLGDFDLLVLPSYNEGQPIVVLEAMTAGIPVVGTDVGGMAQLITDPLVTSDGDTWGPCGRLTAPGDIGAMADALEAVMDDREGYARFAANARGRVTNFFLLDDVMAAYNQLYRELGDLPAGPQPDPTEVNALTMELIHLEVGGRLSSEGVTDPTEANAITMELIRRAAGVAGEVADPVQVNAQTMEYLHAEASGPGAEEAPDPTQANATTIDLIYMESLHPFVGDPLDPAEVEVRLLTVDAAGESATVVVAAGEALVSE
jgi:polysaccharide biosynthesis protein PelF